MTEATYQRAGELLEHIKNIESTVRKLEAISLYNPEKHSGTKNERTKKVLLKFLNLKNRKSDKLEATVLLYDGVSSYGKEIPVDEELLPILRAHYEKKLADAKAEFESLGVD